jgi:hypothetical protein
VTFTKLFLFADDKILHMKDHKIASIKLLDLKNIFSKEAKKFNIKNISRFSIMKTEKEIRKTISFMIASKN